MDKHLIFVKGPLWCPDFAAYRTGEPIYPRHVHSDRQPISFLETAFVTGAAWQSAYNHLSVRRISNFQMARLLVHPRPLLFITSACGLGQSQTGLAAIRKLPPPLPSVVCNGFACRPPNIVANATCSLLEVHCSSPCQSIPRAMALRWTDMRLSASVCTGGGRSK